MRRSITKRILLSAGVTLMLCVICSRVASSSDGNEQVVFSTANVSGTFNYTTPSPPPKDTHFGFWIWCEGPTSTNTYTGKCSGAMYFYGLGITRPVEGTVTGSGGIFTMTVWSTDGKIACSLANASAFTGNGSEKGEVDATCPPPGSTLTPFVQGSGADDQAVINVTGQ